jgi:hypothetical protein
VEVRKLTQDALDFDFEQRIRKAALEALGYK